MTGLFAVIALVYASTYYGDQGWGDDFAQYILHARHIALGRAYVETGYVYTWDTASIGPRWYPPGFPLMLAPVLAYRGLDFTAFQVLLTVVQMFWLAAAFVLFRRALGDGAALVLTSMLGLSPYLIMFRREVMSDIPFAFLTLCALLVIDGQQPNAGHTRWKPFLAAALIAAAAAVREVGFVIVVALAAESIVKRRAHPALVPAGLAVGVLTVALHTAFGPQSYTDQFRAFPVRTVVSNIPHYFVHHMRGFWAGPSVILAGVPVPILWLIALPLAALGFSLRLRRTRGVTELFFVAYTLVILAWPTVQELRFLYPVLPLILLYAGTGAKALLESADRLVSARVMAGVRVLALALLAMIYAVRTTKEIHAAGPVSDGPLTPSAQRLFQAIRADTPPGAVVVFRSPRALTLFADRRGAGFPSNTPSPAGIRYMKRIGAGYAIAETPSTPPSLRIGRFIRDTPHCFDRIRRLDGFDIFLFRCRN